MQTDTWETLANEVCSLEQQGNALSTEWYTNGYPQNNDVETLLNLHRKSLDALRKLSKELDNSLRAKTLHHRDKAQYAYQLVQELIQSRQADVELMQNMTTNSGSNPPEFARALAVKEEAASKQSKQLLDTLQQLQ